MSNFRQFTGLKPEDSVKVDGDYGIPILGVRKDSDTQGTADGDYTNLKIDEEGRLKVATKSASYPLVSGVIDVNGGTSLLTALAAGSFLAADVSRCSNVLVQMLSVSTTLSGYNIQFEGSINSATGNDGTWVVLQAVRSTVNTVETATGLLTTAAGATVNYSWECSVNAYNWFRIRTIARTSGVATWGIQRGTYATEPIPGIQVTGTQPVSGSITSTLAAATTLAGDFCHGVRATTTNTFAIGAAVTAAGVRHLVSAATVNNTILRSAAGRLYGWHISNSTAAWLYVKIHNVAVAPTAGSGVVMTIAVPPNDRVDFESNMGYYFSTGIGCTTVTGYLDNDVAAVTAGSIIADFMVG